MKTLFCSLLAVFLISGTQSWKLSPLTDPDVYKSLESLEGSYESGSSEERPHKPHVPRPTTKPVITPRPPGDANDVYCTLPCGSEHIGCKDNNLTPEDVCPIGVEDMTDYISTIIDYHNKIRNSVAGGNVRDLNPATRMATIRWDNELAKTAEMQARLCIIGTYKCHGTVKFQGSGQNTGHFYYQHFGNPPNVNTYEAILELLQHWYNASAHITPEIISSFTPGKWGYENLSDIGVFTMMVREDNTHVGCAFKNYEAPSDKTQIIFICNYAVDNYLDSPVYEEGPSASKCRSGLNPGYEHLCSVREKYT